MPIEEEGPPPHSRLQSVLEYRGSLSGSTEFDAIKLFLQPMKGVVTDFTTRAHREQGMPSGAYGTRVQPIGRQARLFSW